MNIVLISSDNDLCKLCREILSTFVGYEWHLATATPENSPPDADFYIWDSQAGMDFPPGLR